ncbi:MAG: putative phosphoglycerate mutase [Paraglaciecola sp.]|jgi:probable phosphoglycerate mutase
MSILLIRHGQTRENKNHIVQPADVSLSELGLQQAGLLTERFRSLGIEQILCSDLPRATETANQIAMHTQCPVTLTELLRERNFGTLRGQAYGDIGFNIFAENYAPPEGETWQEFDLRVAKAWQSIIDLAAQTTGRLAIVTHGLVCRSIVNNFLYNERQEVIPDRWDNTSVTEFDKTAPYKIRLLNDTEHLSKTNLNSESSAPA